MVTFVNGFRFQASGIKASDTAVHMYSTTGVCELSQPMNEKDRSDALVDLRCEASNLWIVALSTCLPVISMQ